MTMLFARAALVAMLAMTATSFPAGQTPSAGKRLIVYGDIVYFFGPNLPRNCTMSNTYKRGEPVGFRMTAINPETGTRDRATEVVVHVTYGGKTVDVPMRDRQRVDQPEREFWVGK